MGISARTRTVVQTSRCEVPEPVSAVPAHILLVEDEPLQRQIMAESLSDAGFEVTATCTGDEAAILLADRDRFDALLTDVSIPGSIDGIGLAEHARQIHPGLPVLFVSGGVSHLQRAAALASPTACMEKPVETGRLLAALRDLIGMGRTVPVA